MLADEAAHGVLEVAKLPKYQLARRQRIVDAATMLLRVEDFNQIQMRVVAESAGVALATVYRYFTSKEHLYAAVLIDWAAPFAVADAPKTKDAPSDRLRKRLHRAVASFERRPQFFKVQAMLQTTQEKPAKALYAEFSRRNQEALASEMPTPPDTRTGDAVTILMAVLNNLLTSHVYRGEPIEDVYRIIDLAVDLLAPSIDEGSNSK